VDNSYRILLSLKSSPLSRWFFFAKSLRGFFSSASEFDKQAQESQGFRGLQNFQATEFFFEDQKNKLQKHGAGMKS
jgi:hypothetical protein